VRVHIHPAETLLSGPAIDHRVAADVRRHRLVTGGRIPLAFPHRR
jgi:hypothetical protein